MNGFFLQSTTTPRKACKGIESASLLTAICMVESDRGKWVVKSAFGIVKHGVARPRGLGTNIAPTSLDSSVAAWAEAEWIPRDGSFSFLLK
ncbi:unnamed protein product [Prunus brigantina]